MGIVTPSLSTHSVIFFSASNETKHVFVPHEVKIVVKGKCPFVGQYSFFVVKSAERSESIFFPLVWLQAPWTESGPSGREHWVGEALRRRWGVKGIR